MKHPYLKSILILALGLSLACSALADRIELNDGSMLNGKLVSAEGGKFKFETAFAGTIDIAQVAVKTFATDSPVNVALASGSAILGKVTAGDAGIRIDSGNGQISSATSGIAAVWLQGTDSPAVRAHARK